MTTPEVNRVKYTLRLPTSANDPGAVEWGFYIVKRGSVILTDEGGTPLQRELQRSRLFNDPEQSSRWERKLRDGEDAQRVARQLLIEKYSASKKGGRQPIAYPPLTWIY